MSFNKHPLGFLLLLVTEQKEKKCWDGAAKKEKFQDLLK